MNIRILLISLIVLATISNIASAEDEKSLDDYWNSFENWAKGTYGKFKHWMHSFSEDKKPKATTTTTTTTTTAAPTTVTTTTTVATTISSIDATENCGPTIITDTLLPSLASPQPSQSQKALSTSSNAASTTQLRKDFPPEIVSSAITFVPMPPSESSPHTNVNALKTQLYTMIQDIHQLLTVLGQNMDEFSDQDKLA